jgi:hypothetical protein
MQYAYCRVCCRQQDIQTQVRRTDVLDAQWKDNINPLNAELNPICHLLVLLEDLTFMRLCIVSILQYTCISNKMQRYTVYL